MVDDPLDVRPLHTLEPIQELVEGCAFVEPLVQLGYGQPSTGKHPLASEPVRVSLSSLARLQGRPPLFQGSTERPTPGRSAIGVYRRCRLTYLNYSRSDLSPARCAARPSSPAGTVPGLAPCRGLIEPGKVADMVVVDRDDITRVRHVMVGGRIVVEDGRRVNCSSTW